MTKTFKTIVVSVILGLTILVGSLYLYSFIVENFFSFPEYNATITEPEWRAPAVP